MSLVSPVRRPKPVELFVRPEQLYDNLGLNSPVSSQEIYARPGTFAAANEINIPRKRSNAPRRQRQMDIWLDGDEDGQSLMEEPQSKKHQNAHTLSKQAEPSGHPSRNYLQQTEKKENGMGTAKRPRRRVSALLADRDSTLNSDTMRLKKVDKIATDTTLIRDPRRRTIYVPSDDTTVFTIHPGIATNGASARDTFRSASVKHVERNGFDIADEQLNNTSETITKRTSTSERLAAAPKRVPLQASKKSTQTAQFLSPLPGSGPGKENVPPGYLRSKKISAPANKPLFHTVSETGNSATKKRARLVTQTSSCAITSMKQSEIATDNAQKRKSYSPRSDSDKLSLLKKGSCAERPGLRAKPLRHITANPLSDKTNRTSSLQGVKGKPGAAPHKLSVPVIKAPKRNSLEKFPVIQEDITNAARYEDSWLSHQEAAITQLVNGLFDSAGQTRKQIDCPFGLRKKLLCIYHDAEMSLLHRRLNASLLYGALSLPREQLSKIVRLYEDLGLRRKFLDFWLDTYKPTALIAAAEAITGREFPRTTQEPSRSPTKEQEGMSKPEKRTMEDFLCTFLIRNSDAVQKYRNAGSIKTISRGAEDADSSIGTPEWSIRRTILRSLMMILLLDKAKVSAEITGCLFLSSSPYKSTKDVLVAFSHLLLPSLGDVTKKLGHLNYHVHHVQYPLEERTYWINNLATDLRDGVILTHLVELLLYPPSSLDLHRENATNTTITMPNGETLDLLKQDGDSWVLSQYLKLPCHAKPQKVYNVQIALSALHGVKGMGEILKNVKAEDIVDGYREKTLGLLWGLVGKWGLSALIDGKMLEAEIQNLRRKLAETCPAKEEEVDFEEDFGELEYLEGLERHKYLLKLWASYIGHLHGVRVSNLTTSFADGRVFAKIVEEYEVYFPQIASDNGASNTPSQGQTLDTKLLKLGCSHHFASLFGASISTGRVFDRDFVLAGLAFLCSRLVTVATKVRATITIQRAYRHMIVRRTIHRRITLMKLAHDCQSVVLTRDRVIAAATTIQQAWRSCLDRRIKKLVKSVILSQALARGWIARRNLEQQKARRERRLF